jgi:hypothetical protein
MHVFRWDIDKTYLDTDIHGVRAMLRAAFETAAEKRNVPGSGALLRGLLRVDPESRVAVVSGSPEQLRSVIAEKLALDGIRVDHLVLKDHLGAIRKGRFKAVYGQLGYKLPTLLEQRVGLGATVTETCFGDDSEVDAVVYTLFAEAVAGRVSEEELARVLRAGAAYPDAIERSLAALRRVGHADAVEDVFVHVARGIPEGTFRLLGARVIPVHSWFQAALVLWTRDRLDGAGVDDVVTDGAWAAPQLASFAQDLVRRGHLSASDLLERLPDSAAMRDARPLVEPAIETVAEQTRPPLASRPDWLRFLAALKSA